MSEEKGHIEMERAIYKDVKGMAEPRGNPKQAKFRMEDPISSAGVAHRLIEFYCWYWQLWKTQSYCHQGPH